MPGLAASLLGWLCHHQGSSGGCQPCPGAAGAVLAVTLVPQRQVRESNNGPSTPQGGLWVHGGLCVKQGVTSTGMPSKVLPCSQNKQQDTTVLGAAARPGARPPPSPVIAACPQPGMVTQVGVWDAGGWCEPCGVSTGEMEAPWERCRWRWDGWKATETSPVLRDRHWSVLVRPDPIPLC